MLVGIGCLLALALRQAAGRDNGQAPAPPGLVQVPVQVLLDGEPVRGLEAADFELREDGARRGVSGFEVVELGPSAPAVHATFPAARSAQPPAPQAAQPPAPQAAQPPAGRS